MDFEIVAQPTFLGGVGEAVGIVARLDKKGEHGMGADFINAAGDEFAERDAVAEQIHLGRNINFVKCDGFSVGERGPSELSAGGGDGALAVVRERKILRLLTGCY